MGLRDFLKNKAREAIGRPPRELARDVKERSQRLRELPKAADAQGYRAVCFSDMIEDGAASSFAVHDTVVAVFHRPDGWFAIDSACTHEDGPLEEGTVDGTVVTCPYHDWRFDLRDGACLSANDRAVGCYPVQIKGDVVWVGPPRRTASDARGGEHDDGLEMV